MPIEDFFSIFSIFFKKIISVLKIRLCFVFLGISFEFIIKKNKRFYLVVQIRKWSKVDKIQYNKIQYKNEYYYSGINPVEF